jgi:hypothetical protein
MKTKDAFLLPESHLELLNSVIENVDEILIIGWKGNENYFNDFLKQKLNEKPVKVLLVCKMDKQIVSKLESVFKHPEFLFHTESFRSDNDNSMLDPATFSAFITSNYKNRTFKFFD